LKNRIPLALLAAAVCASLLLTKFETRAASAAAPDGKAIFASRCSACHQATGVGGGPYPPLAGNPDITGADTTAIIASVLNGRSGPILVNGKEYGGAMPAWRATLTNAEIAAVLTYVRAAWGNKAAIVTEDQVAAASNPMALSGASLFAAKCATCHQNVGQGSDTYPPLAHNPDVTDDAKGMIATIVNGRSGTLTVNGKTYNSKMPTWKGQLSNADIAIVATYIRSVWGNHAPGVSEQDVAAAGAAVNLAVGQSIYSKRCAGCHSANGQGGGGGMFPALAGNKNVAASDPTAMLVTIQHGRNMMPSWKGQLSSSDIAAVVTYIRAAWGNKAGPVSDQDVAAVK
jgi:cbb3-type cytochrome c oxidase subunit III